MGYLAVTFRGPFAFCLEADHIKVFAAICENHHAGIFTVLREYPLKGRHRKGGEYTYVLQAPGAENNKGDIQYHEDPNTCIILDAESGSAADICQAGFCIVVPRPFDIYPINPANTEVVKSDPKGALGNYATGLRFVYKCDLSKDVSLETPRICPDKPRASLPLEFGDLAQITNYADIDIEYVGPQADDSDHLDAISCFDNTMRLFNLPWWLNYDDYDKMELRTRTGSDCKSAVVIAGRV